LSNKALPCHYFPELPARWYCPSCDRNYSAACLKEKPSYEDEDNNHCPICHKNVNSLGVANTIRPFWELLPVFFKYPLKSDALIYLISISLLSLLSFLGVIAQIIIAIITFYSIFLYSFKCLNHTARGNLDSPGSIDNYTVINRNLVYKQLFILILPFIIVFIGSAYIGSLVGKGIAFFLVLGIPASTMLLVINGSVLDAINPFKIFSTMTLIGKSYLGLYLMLILMVSNRVFVENIAIAYITPFVIKPALVFIQSYFTIAMYTMLGYIIYQYHEELGFDGVEEPEETKNPVAIGLSSDSFINEITILIKEGMQNEAIKRLQKKVKHSNDLEYFKKLHQLLLLTGRVNEFIEYEEKYIKTISLNETISKMKGLQDILAIYRACMDAKPDYYYPDQKVVFEVGQLAHESFYYDDVLRVFNNFHQHFPQSPNIPNAYLLVAKVMTEHKQKDKQAIQILNFLLKNYPQDKLIPDIKEYLQVINNLEVS
jgi:tetratricopeptide (TPR) repeat protein